MAKRERSPGLLPPIRANFKDAVRAMLGTPLTDDVKGSRNVKSRKPKSARRASRKAPKR
jgi:hypothetical protein